MDLLSKYQDLIKRIELLNGDTTTNERFLNDVNGFEKVLIDFEAITEGYKLDLIKGKQAELDFEERMLKLNCIIEQISDGIIVFDINRSIVIWNKGVEEITGIKPDDALGHKIEEIQFQLLTGKYKDKSFIEQKVNEVVTFSNPNIYGRIFDNEIFVPSKGVRVIQNKIFPISLNSNELLFGNVMRDITDLKQVENELLELNTSKDLFMSLLAHDLRGPIGTILNMSNQMLANFHNYDAEKIKQVLTLNTNAIQKTYNLLENLLLWSQANSGKASLNAQFLNLNEVCLEVINSFKESLDTKNIIVHFAENKAFNVYADSNMLKTVLRNLISNAIKFSFQNSLILIYFQKTADEVIVAVSDGGMGMSESMQKKLWNIGKVFSTDGTSKETGSGLGLMICKEFIRKHNGKIWVDSQPGKGSTFKFSLPLIA
jgi:PAS domain S-box-containing protein